MSKSSVVRQLIILHVLNSGASEQRFPATYVRTRVENQCVRQGFASQYKLDTAGKPRDESSRKKWQRDVDELRASGLVKTSLANEESGQDDMLVAVPMGKPREFWLTLDEHRALSRARSGFEAISRRASARQSNHLNLDLAFRLMRDMEESLGPVSVRDFARSLGLRSKTVSDLMDVLFIVYDVEQLNEIWPDSDSGLEDLADLDHEVDELDRMVGFWPNHRGESAPLRETGLDEVGRFAYTKHECRQRLKAIQWAIAEPSTSDGDRFLLERAEWKLERWYEMLPNSLSVADFEAGDDFGPELSPSEGTRTT